MNRIYHSSFLALLLVAFCTFVNASNFDVNDVFGMEYAADPQISPDGKQVVYVRQSFDIMKDRSRSNLWIVDSSGKNHRPIASSAASSFSPRWSPSGDRLAYASSHEGSVQIYIRWMDSGQTARLSDLTSSPGSLSWSPDGKQIAFTMAVSSEGAKPIGNMPAKPEGAEWAPPVRVIDTLNYRSDGLQGFLPAEYAQVFVISSDGGTPRQLTKGDFSHRSSLSWGADSKTLYLTTNHEDDWQYNPFNADVYSLTVTDGEMKRLTNRVGPDHSPAVSPDGSKIAYLGFDDQEMLYENSRVYIMDIDGSNSRVVNDKLDRTIDSVAWDSDSKELVVQYDDGGETLIAHMSLAGKLNTLASNTGGTNLGRPYGGGSFSVANDGSIAFNQASPQRPAELAVMNKSGKSRLITNLNDFCPFFAAGFENPEIVGAELRWLTIPGY